jgi:hypothetical protein
MGKLWVSYPIGVKEKERYNTPGGLALVDSLDRFYVFHPDTGVVERVGEKPPPVPDVSPTLQSPYGQLFVDPSIPWR